MRSRKRVSQRQRRLLAILRCSRNLVLCIGIVTRLNLLVLNLLSCQLVDAWNGAAGGSEVRSLVVPPIRLLCHGGRRNLQLQLPFGLISDYPGVVVLVWGRRRRDLVEVSSGRATAIDVSADTRKVVIHKLLVHIVGRRGRVRHDVHLRRKLNIGRDDGGLPRALHGVSRLHRYQVLAHDGALLRKHHGGLYTLQACRVSVL